MAINCLIFQLNFKYIIASKWTCNRRKQKIFLFLQFKREGITWSNKIGIYSNFYAKKQNIAAVNPTAVPLTTKLKFLIELN